MIVVGWILFVGLACYLGAFPEAMHPTLKWIEQPVHPIRERKGRLRSVFLDKAKDMNNVEGV
ncbi:mitochondrial sheath formation-associated protein [Notamacropus eugenii]|uniref:mitochondrial sheath formation-associated protein n=1 Tax=Notamacropus eugenii TaxID=9315 RepID=UPI003B6745FF